MPITCKPEAAICDYSLQIIYYVYILQDYHIHYKMTTQCDDKHH